jgi:DNA invertase Pin-like site-specific DNA recombinase
MTAHRGSYVAYYRVSTHRQGKSGLGLEAQQQAVANYLNGGNWKIVGEFVEVESGKHADRPQLAAALAACRRLRAKLVIAKLDRLSRNLAFVAALTDSGIEFTACDNPHANKLTIHILAAVAQHEREQISQRTRDALAAAKRRGKQLGGYKGTPPTKAARKLAAAALRAKADARAADIAPAIAAAQAAGAASLRAIAAHLNEHGIPTARGTGHWSAVQVARVLERQGGAS